MWKTANSVYKSANKNIKKLGNNLPSISTVSSIIQNIQINSLIPTIKKNPSSQLQNTMNSIFSSKKTIMPINKMSLIAQMSYDNQNFDRVYDLILSKIKVFKYQSKQAKKTLNTLILLSYLIKNGPSGFVDEFRQQMKIFQGHSQISLQNAYINEEKEIQKLKPLLTQIKQRAKYIMGLLTDKKKLLKEKQISMEIKRRIIESAKKENELVGNERQTNSLIFQGRLINQPGQGSEAGQKVESFLQHYVWKYWNRFDEKIQNITEKIIQKIDEYLDLQEPQSFSIEQLEVEVSEPTKPQTNLEKVVKIEEQKFLKTRNDIQKHELQEEGPVLNTELI